MTDEPKLGATGEFPEGKLSEDDEGELTTAVGFDENFTNVIVKFGKPVAWFGLPKKSAIEFAQVILKYAHELPNDG